MKTFNIKVSQNGWEYTGDFYIDCEEGVVKVEGCDNEILIDSKIKIIFDEEVGDIKEVIK